MSGVSWIGSPAAQASMIWDLDSQAHGESFDAGNSTLAGYQGTYRNGSDLTTGLDYSVSPISPGDAAARTGYVGDSRTLNFHFTGGAFTSGHTFEFDCDTDGGLGYSGEDMAGMRISISLTDGSVLNGQLIADPSSPASRSFADL